MRTGKTHGGSDWFSDLANRHLCWAFAASGTTLFAGWPAHAWAGTLSDAWLDAPSWYRHPHLAAAALIIKMDRRHPRANRVLYSRGDN